MSQLIDFPITQEVQIPAGEYYLGDISYALSEWTIKEYGPLCAEQYAMNEFPAGDGRKCVIYTTHIGDGIYYDNEGDSYFVDAGSIGLIPVEAVEEDDCYHFGCVLVFDEPTTAFASPKHDFLCFGDTTIYTGLDEEIAKHWPTSTVDDEVDEYQEAVAAVFS